MLKRTPLKTGNKLLKRSPLKSNGSVLNKGKKKLKTQSTRSKDLWAVARDKCIIRDKGLCQVCGKTGTQVHHIFLRSKRKDLIYTLSNLVLLCDKHHFHKASEGYLEQTMIIATAKGLTVEELFYLAEKGE